MSDELLGLGGSTDPFANGAKGRNKCVALFCGAASPTRPATRRPRARRGRPPNSL